MLRRRPRASGLGAVAPRGRGHANRATLRNQDPDAEMTTGAGTVVDAWAQKLNCTEAPGPTVPSLLALIAWRVLPCCESCAFDTDPFHTALPSPRSTCQL